MLNIVYFSLERKKVQILANQIHKLFKNYNMFDLGWVINLKQLRIS